LRSRSFSVYVTTPGRYGSREDTSSPVIIRRTLDTGESIEETWMPVYYGGGLDEQRALPVDVRPEAHVGAVDITVNNARVRSHRIRGVVINGSNGQPAAGAHVRLVPQISAPHLIMPNANTDTKGAFDIGGLVPGTYWLVAALKAGRGGGAGETVFDVDGVPAVVMPLQVGGRDIDNMKVAIKPSFSVQGRIMADTDLSRLRVRVFRDPDILGMPNSEPRFSGPGAAPNGTPSAEGVFTLRALTAGDYRVDVSSLPENAYVKSIRFGNSDVLNTGMHIADQPQGQLEIIIASNGAGVEGTLVDAKQQPVANATLLIAPDMPLRTRMDLYKTVSSDASGRFRLSGITPGDYELFALELIETDAWHDPAFLRSIEGKGQRVRLDEGARRRVQVTVLP